MDKPVIKKGEKILVYGLAIFTDVLQFVLDIFIVSELINHIIDIIFGGLLLWYAHKRKLLTANTVLTFAAVFVAEQIPFFNALPFWTYDIRNIYKNSPKPPETNPEVTLPRGDREEPVNSIPNVRPPRKSPPQLPPPLPKR